MSSTKSQKKVTQVLAMAIDDQFLFESHCKEHLSDFKNIWNEASKKYNDTLELLKDEDMHQARKQNIATREGNLILVKYLTDIGMQEWRPKKGDKVNGHNQKATGGAVSSGVKPMQPIPKGVQGIKLDW